MLDEDDLLGLWSVDGVASLLADCIAFRCVITAMMQKKQVSRLNNYSKCYS